MKDKTFVRVPIMADKGRAIALADRVVYGLLVYLSQYDKTASVRDVAQRLGMTFRTAKQSLWRLDLAGLAACSDGKWHACEPSDWSLFATREHESWQERFKSWRMYCRASGSFLPFKTNALYWLLTSLARSKGRGFRQTVRGLATLLGLSRRSVQRMLATLDRALLVERGTEYVFVLSPTTELVSSIQDTAKRFADDASKPDNKLIASTQQIVTKQADDFPMPTWLTELEDTGDDIQTARRNWQAVWNEVCTHNFPEEIWTWIAVAIVKSPPGFAPGTVQKLLRKAKADHFSNPQFRKVPHCGFLAKTFIEAQWKEMNREPSNI